LFELLSKLGPKSGGHIYTTMQNQPNAILEFEIFKFWSTIRLGGLICIAVQISP